MPHRTGNPPPNRYTIVAWQLNPKGLQAKNLSHLTR